MQVYVPCDGQLKRTRDMNWFQASDARVRLYRSDVEMLAARFGEVRPWSVVVLSFPDNPTMVAALSFPDNPAMAPMPLRSILPPADCKTVGAGRVYLHYSFGDPNDERSDYATPRCASRGPSRGPRRD